MRDPRSPHLILALALAGLLFSGCDGPEPDNTGDSGSSPVAAPTLVKKYCAYGAASEAQVRGCKDHVTDEDVNGYDTNAAEYARGELDECLADAGPFCSEGGP